MISQKEKFHSCHVCCLYYPQPEWESEMINYGNQLSPIWLKHGLQYRRGSQRCCPVWELEASWWPTSWPSSLVPLLWEESSGCSLSLLHFLQPHCTHWVSWPSPENRSKWTVHCLTWRPVLPDGPTCISCSALSCILGFLLLKSIMVLALWKWVGSPSGSKPRCSKNVFSFTAPICFVSNLPTKDGMRLSWRKYVCMIDFNSLQPPPVPQFVELLTRHLVSKVVQHDLELRWQNFALEAFFR